MVLIPHAGAVVHVPDDWPIYQAEAAAHLATSLRFASSASILLLKLPTNPTVWAIRRIGGSTPVFAVGPLPFIIDLIPQLPPYAGPGARPSDAATRENLTAKILSEL